jgi:hypothetical protein
LDISSRSDLELGLNNLVSAGSLLGSRISGLPEGILRLLSELVISSTREKPENKIDIQWETHALHLLQFISRVTKGDASQNVAEAIVSILTRTSNHPKTSFAVVWSLLQHGVSDEEQCEHIFY